MKREKVVLDEIRGAAQRIIIRLDLGEFIISGPSSNILNVESRVAFSTAINELQKDGYEMVSPKRYAESYGISVEKVHQKIAEEGTLFALVYPEDEAPLRAVPLEEKEEGLGPHLQ